MSEPNTNEQSMQQTIRCINPECTKEFIVMLPHAEVINSMTVSLVIWTHPDIQACPHCGIPYQMKVQKIQGVEVMWGPVKTDRQRQAGIVVPPPGFRLPPRPEN